MAGIVDVEGIGKAYAEKLKAVGVATTDKLLELGASAAGRAKLAADSGLSPKQLLEWVNHADLMRVKGVGSEYADLLEAAGVDSVPELAQRVSANLAAKLAEVNEKSKLVRQLPTAHQVAGWIEQATSLGRTVTH